MSMELVKLCNVMDIISEELGLNFAFEHLRFLLKIAAGCTDTSDLQHLHGFSRAATSRVVMKLSELGIIETDTTVRGISRRLAFTMKGQRLMVRLTKELQ